jgi:hypothetical protein
MKLANSESQVCKKLEVNLKTLMALLFTLSLSSATEWSLLGPSDVKVYDYVGNPEYILCTENGLYIDSADVCKNYSNGLPILDVHQLNADTLLLVMSNGSWSDGLYAFNLKKKTFDVVYYCGFPRFIYYEPIVPTFFLGTLQGCYYSGDGKDWVEITALHGLECYSMASYQGQMAISTSDGIYWHAVQLSYPFQKSEGSPVLTDLTHDYNGNFYGVYPGSSRSAGIWISNDFGITWENEFYERNLSTVFWIGFLLVGWENPNANHQGVAKWDSLNKQLYFINNGLPAARVNRFSTNYWMNCINVVCCTDSGAYFTCNIMQSKIDNHSQFLPQEFNIIQNYPNPFNSTTTIEFNLPKSGWVSLRTYDLQGRLVQNLIEANLNAGNHIYHWEAPNLPSGIYLITLSSGGHTITKKTVLVK